MNSDHILYAFLLWISALVLWCVDIALGDWTPLTVVVGVITFFAAVYMISGAIAMFHGR